MSIKLVQIILSQEGKKGTSLNETQFQLLFGNDYTSVSNNNNYHVEVIWYTKISFLIDNWKEILQL